MNKIIGFVMVGTNDLDRAGKFYDKILPCIGLKRVISKDNRYIGYGHSKDEQEVKFYVCNPFNKQKATIGNGCMVALSAESRDMVNEFHAVALKNGAFSEGDPGERSDGNYYGYIRDLDGNKLAARFVGKKNK